MEADLVEQLKHEKEMETIRADAAVKVAEVAADATKYAADAAVRAAEIAAGQ